MNSLLLAFALFLSQPATSPADFIQVAGPSLKAKFDSAIQQGRRGADDTFWVAYQIPVRAGVHVDSQFGGLNIMRSFDGIELMPPGNTVNHVGIFFLAHKSDGGIEKGRLLDMNNNYVFHDRKVYWIGEPSSSESLDLLMGVLRDEQAAVSSTITTAISIHETSGSVDKLVAIARGGFPNDAKRSAINQLGDEASLQAATELDRMAADSNFDSELQRQVVTAISRRANDEAIPMLIGIALNHPVVAVRRQAITALGQKQDKRAVDFLEQQLSKK